MNQHGSIYDTPTARAHSANELQHAALVTLAARQMRAALLGPTSEVQLRYRSLNGRWPLENSKSQENEKNHSEKSLEKAK